MWAQCLSGLPVIFFCPPPHLFVLYFYAFLKLSYFLDSFLYSNERERERKVWVWMGGEVGRIWEEFGVGDLNQNVLYEKNQ